jgi:hypothetical protein
MAFVAPIVAWVGANAGAIAAVGSAVSAVGMVQQGRAQSAAAEANAQAMETQAAQERLAAGAREESFRRETRQFLGTQRAALAQAGVGLSGSAYDVARTSAVNAEMDALNIRYEGELAARGLQGQAAMSRFDGKQARTAANWGAGAALLQGASNYAGMSSGAVRPSKSYTAPRAPRKG